MGVTSNIRPAVPEDAAAIAAGMRAIAIIPGRIASRPDEITEEVIRQRIGALAKYDTARFVVIECDGEIVGHALIDPLKLETTSHVVNFSLAIHEGHQGKGLGRALLQHLVDWSKAHPKIEKFELHVRSSNTRAIKLYESMGFVEEGRKTKRVKYGPNDYQDDVYMALWVGP